VLKYLRIAVTALSLTACVLLIALWVRSYCAFSYINGPLPNTDRFYQVASRQGQLTLSERLQHPSDRVVYRPFWTIKNVPLENVKSDQINLGVLGVRWHVADTRSVIRIAYWLPVAITSLFVVILATLDRLSFSLRTLLIATTLVAVGLGVVINLAR